VEGLMHVEFITIAMVKQMVEVKSLEDWAGSLDFASLRQIKVTRW
jgi:hypothetical protein